MAKAKQAPTKWLTPEYAPFASRLFHRILDAQLFDARRKATLNLTPCEANQLRILLVAVEHDAEGQDGEG
jgi:hypothetical protein